MNTGRTTSRPFFRKTDWIAVGLLIVFSLSFWGIWLLSHKTDQVKIEIYSDNRLVRTIPLPTADSTIRIPDQKVSLEIRDNAVRFCKTDCPDQTCVKTGFIRNSGQSAICLPNRIVVKIVGASPSSSVPDGIAS